MFVLKLMFWLIELTLMVGVISYCVYITGLLISRLFEVPFVPSDLSAVRQVFSFINPSPGMRFLELGCGDGRVICSVIKKYKLCGRGIDMNPILVMYARVRANVMGISREVNIARGDARNADFEWADIIYMFMIPKFLHDKSLSDRLLNQLKPGTFVISHWYEIPYLQSKEVHRVTTGTHETIVYRI